jgi:hypothetical protein
MNPRKPRFYLDWKAAQQRHYFDDFVFLAQIEDTCLVLTGVDTLRMTLNPILGDTLRWGVLKLVSTLTGKVVTVASGSSAIRDGDVIYVRDVKHPIENQTVSLHVERAGSRDVKKFGNIFLGTRVGTALMMRPAGKVTGDIVRLDGDAYLPISEAENGGAAPGALTSYVDGDARVRVRLFVRASGDTVHYTWETPKDLNVLEPVTARWYGIVTGSEILVTESTRFGLSGFVTTDAGDLDGTFGATAYSVSSGAHALGTRIMGSLVTLDLSNLGPNRLVQLRLQRDTGDAYVGSVYIYGVKLYYKREQG